VLLSETIHKLAPHRSMYLRGFDRRGAAAAMHHASAAGFTVSGCWSDQADFAVAVLFDADDQYGHLFTSRYLPDFSLAGVTLDFDLALTGCQCPLSGKYPSVAWGALSFINNLETPGTTPLAPLSTSSNGAQVASRTYTVNGTPALGDRVQLVYLSNVVWDHTVIGPAAVSFSFYWYGPGTVHSITIGGATYSYTEGKTDTANSIAAAIAGAVNDPNATASAAGNSVTLTPKLACPPTLSCSASDGNGPGTLRGAETPAFIAADLVDQITKTNWGAVGAQIELTASLNGASFTITPSISGSDGNSIELLELHATPTAYLTPGGSSKLTGGADPTSMHFHFDFSVLGLASVRQIWLTLAPALNYSGAGGLAAYAPCEFSAVFSNWTVGDASGVTVLKLAGPGSVTIGSSDAWTTYAGSGWSQVAGWYFGGFARQSSHAGDTVSVEYSCQFAHNLYLGTALVSGAGTFNATLDGAAVAPVSLNADSASAIVTRRLLAAGVAAGSHTVVLTVSGACTFDFLQAAVLSDALPAPITYPEVSAACDFDTSQTYQIPPERLAWILSQFGFAGDIDFYAGVFFALRRVRSGGNFHAAVVTIAGPFSIGTGYGNGDALYLQVGGSAYGDGKGTEFGVAVYPADTLTTLAQRLVNAINALFVGIWASVTGAGQLTITTLSPINGFTLFSKGTGISISGDIGVGTEGVWQVDASQASPLNSAFTAYLSDFSGLLHTAGLTMTVAFSQELLAPPDTNTAAGAWTQRFADGTQVLTATGFGSWGAGLVEGISGSTIQVTAHGYITGNTWHGASAAGSGAWTITVIDTNHFSLATQVSNSGGYVPSVGDACFIELQTSQCCFNPSTVGAYLAACYKQAAGILSAAGLVPWLQFGEVGWWFFSRVQGLAVGYASWTAPISIGTQLPHTLLTGQRAILAGVQGNTAANGLQTVTVTDATHCTLNGTNGNGNYVAATGTITGGGMAYYDAYTAQAAMTTLGRALASFYTQADDPTVNGGVDVAFLAGLMKAHIDGIRAAVLAVIPTAKFELLWPYDVNYPSCYWSNYMPWPQGGALNRAVNLPAAYMAKSGSGLDRFKVEGLSWGSTYRTLAKAEETITFPWTVAAWSKADSRLLIPWMNGGCAWPKEYLYAVGAGMPGMGFWALDHLCLMSWPAALPAVGPRSATVSG
jgi:hypothetical protein